MTFHLLVCFSISFQYLPVFSLSPRWLNLFLSFYSFWCTYKWDCFFLISLFNSLLLTSLVAEMVKHPPAVEETWFNPQVGKVPWRREWLSTPVFLPEEFHGQKCLVGYSPWGGVTESWTQLSNFYSLTCH